MDDETGAPPADPRPRARAAVALAGLAVGAMMLALLHPVLETLGRHPEFFVARPTPRRDALLVGVALAVVAPGALWAVVALAGRWSSHLAAGISAVAVATSGALVMLRALPGVPVLAVVIGAVAGVGLAVVVWRDERVGRVARWGAVVPLLSLAFFLVVLPSSRVVWDDADPVAAGATADDPVPVVFVVFDELPMATLLEGPERIDDERFPHFAAFAQDAVWYRNATTVTDRTSGAVPAVLTGTRPAEDALPIAADHPQSLYTLLADSHDVHAVEPVTAICPAGICDEPQDATSASPAGLSALSEDVGLVGLHVLLPEAWTQSLPPVDQTWGAFVEEQVVTELEGFDLGAQVDQTALGDRRADLQDVIAPAGERPPAYVLHSMLPHVPYRYLPSGQATSPVLLAGLEPDDTWSADTWLREHAHRQHLLQTGLADRVLGQVLEDLRTSGLHDEAMIVVVADHGVAFTAGHGRREVSRATLAEVAAVPMMVRYPDGPHGVVDRRPVEVIDLLPTVADLMGIEVDRPFDGTSLLDDGPRPDTRTIATIDAAIEFTPDEADPWRVARSVQDRFGGDWDELYASVPDGDLVGRRVANLPIEPPSGLAIVDHRPQLSEFTPDSTPIVGVLSGGLAFDAPLDEHVRVAVAFDGVIVAVGRTIERDGNTAAFHALLDPGSYDRDVEPLEVFRIVGDGRLQGPLLDPGT